MTSKIEKIKEIYNRLLKEEDEIKRREEHEKIRKKFIKEYSVENFRKLKLEDYSNLKSITKEYLGYKVEFGEFNRLGYFKLNGPAYKFIIYKNQKDGKYRIGNVELDDKEAEKQWEKIRECISSFLESIKDVKSVDNIKYDNIFNYENFKNILGKDYYLKEGKFNNFYTHVPEMLLYFAIQYYPNKFIGIKSHASLDKISDIVLTTKISSEGFSFVVDHEGHLILSQKKDGLLSTSSIAEETDLRTSPNKDIAVMAKHMLQEEEGSYRITLDGITYNVTFSPIRTVNWSFAVAVNEDITKQVLERNRELIRAETQEQVEDISARIFQTMLLMVAAIIIIIAVIGFFGQKLSKKLTEPILELSSKVRKISGGNLDEKIDIHTGDEIEHLATCFNAMTSELKNYMENLTKVTAEKEKISTELNVATSIQQSMLPHDFNFGRADFEIYATMHAAKSVGGDFYDFYLLDENHLMITIADVSGKGVPAALFMMRGKTILKNFAMTMSSPDDLAAVMTLANNQLCQGNDEMMFITVFMALLDTKTGNLIYVNGGHNPPLVYNSQEKIFSYLSVKENCVLGMMEEIDFEQQEITLNHGDIIYLYTDGVTEAMDENNNQYGEKRLENFLNKIDVQISLEEILKEVHKDLSVHVGAAEQSDDITMLAVRFN